ncbi:MAG: hypothetical protein HKO80_09190 [Flavobacteriaceae bacterium]|nr:hypothetical protein [Flavobacteriaceae bacterium]
MKMKLLCLGDSLTQGYEIPENLRWTDLLSKELGIEVINCGISGDTTAGMLSRCMGALIEHEPTHLIVLGGTNDLWFGLNDEQILANIHAIYRQAKYHNVECIIAIPPPVIQLNELNLVHENYSECIRSFQSALMQYAKDDECPYIKFSKELKSDHYLEDGVHINEKGQVIMMKKIAEKLVSDFS